MNSSEYSYVSMWISFFFKVIQSFLRLKISRGDDKNYFYGYVN